MIWKKKFSPIAVVAMIIIAMHASSAASLSNINVDDSASDTNTNEQQQRRPKSINKSDDYNQVPFILNKIDKLNRRLDTNQIHHRRIKAAQSTKAKQTLTKDQTTKAQQTTNAIDKANNNAQQRRLNQNDSLYYKILKEDHINEVGSTYYKSHYDNMIKEATNYQAATNTNAKSNYDSSNNEEESDMEEGEMNGWGPFVEHIEEEVDTAHHAHIIHHSATTADTDEDTPITCPDGRDYIPNTYCGRDRVECDEGQFCHVHPTDLYAVCCHVKEEDDDTPSPSHTVSPSPSGTSHWPSRYYPSSFSPSPDSTGSYEPTPVYSTDVYNSGKCTAKDRMIWIANDGETTRPQHSQYCFEKYQHYDMNGDVIEGCLMDSECLEMCWQDTYGYTEECSECFASIHQCSMNYGCMEVCSTNMTSSECIDCDEPCTEELYDCTGFPQVPNTDGSGKSGKSGASGGGKGGKSGVDGKSGKSG